MIIVEGPDGAGKSTLVEQLREWYPSMMLAPRASSSGPEGGPVPDLYEWTHRDVHSWPNRPLSIYDRHPLISEYIYGPVIRGTIDPRFHGTGLHRYMSRRALLVLCLPPLNVVRRSVSAERDMAGVAAHIDTIWTLYASLRATWPDPLSVVRYDYTDTMLDSTMAGVVHRINLHRNDWEREDHGN